MLKRNVLFLVIGLWSVAATAQVPVVEAGSRRGQAAAAQPQASSNDLVLQLYTQLEALQGEIQTLRGMVEEQSNQIRRMQQDNRDRYLDVDRRLSELSGAGAATGTTLPPTLGGVPGNTTGGVSLPPTTTGTAPFVDPQGAGLAPAVTFGNTTSAAGAPSATGNPQGTQPTGVAPTVASANVAGAPAAGQGVGAELGERDLYSTALNILLEQQVVRYEESVGMFQSYIQRFPQGGRLTNAYYWLGEALILVERYEEARDAFSVLINTYPDDAKAAGSLLKRGEVYQRMGQRELAEQDWREIATRYPEAATEIREAETRLRRQ